MMKYLEYSKDFAGIGAPLNTSTVMFSNFHYNDEDGVDVGADPP